MNIRLTFTLIISKLVLKALRFLGRGGTSLPGEYARKLYPDVLKLISKDFRLIMVTGTNGKTTTTLIIAKMLEDNGIEFITNKSGANLVDGITTTFLEAVGINGKSKIKTALIEIDEAHFNKFTKHRTPDVLIVTNFFRDQLDRYGELYATLNKVKSGISESPDVKLILNADDSLCSSLGKDTGRETMYYGFSEKAYDSRQTSMSSDAAFCVYCMTKYDYIARIYGHLGHFSCPGCGYERPDSNITCTQVEDLKNTYSSIKFTVGAKTTATVSEQPQQFRAKINLPGLYNIYNALAALALADLLQLDMEKCINALGAFDSGFGRMESIETDGKTITMILVKNPAGFNQVLNFLKSVDSDMTLAFAINDKIADGTDVSWLWDVDFEELTGMANKIKNIFTSGTRADDMAVRLKYAGMETGGIDVEKDFEKLLLTALDKTPEGGNLYILPTYTAMLDIRAILKKRFNLKEFWK